MASALLAGISVGALVPLPVEAQSSRDQCEAVGGDFDKDGSMNTCSIPVGGSSNVKTDAQKGSWNSSHPESFVNPGGNEPAGQQGGDNIGK